MIKGREVAAIALLAVAFIGVAFYLSRPEATAPGDRYARLGIWSGRFEMPADWRKEHRR